MGPTQPSSTPGSKRASPSSAQVPACGKAGLGNEHHVQRGHGGGEGTAGARAEPRDPQQLERQGDPLRGRGREPARGYATDTGWVSTSRGEGSSGGTGLPFTPAAGGSVPLTVTLTAAGGDSMCSQSLAPLPGAAAFPQPLRPTPTLESVFTAEICICCKFQQSSSYRFQFPKTFNALGQT